MEAPTDNSECFLLRTAEKVFVVSQDNLGDIVLDDSQDASDFFQHNKQTDPPLGGPKADGESSEEVHHIFHKTDWLSNYACMHRCPFPF